MPSSALLSEGNNKRWVAATGPVCGGDPVRVAAPRQQHRKFGGHVIETITQSKPPRVVWGCVMSRYGFLLSAMMCAFAVIVSPIADAGPMTGQRLSPSNYMRIHGPAQAPYGFVRFCEANAHHCAAGQTASRRFNATPERLSELDQINRFVNSRIQPKTDAQIYGVSEYWTLPTTVGDCEDYALLKRQILIDRGWPPSSLLLTVVRDELGDGHAILTARTAQGDFILDNKITDVRIWNATPYEYVMRQSYVNPLAWVSLDAAYTDVPVEMAGAGRN